SVGQGPDLLPPPAEMVKGLRRLLGRGQPFVFLHHALAGWPAWPEFAEILGGRFLYVPADLRGRPCLDSGYRQNVSYKARTVGDHPILAGLPPVFDVTDELYLAEIFEQ